MNSVKFKKTFRNINRGKNDKKDIFKGYKGKVKKKQLYKSKQKSWEIIDAEISDLNERTSKIDTANVQSFKDFPLSKRSLQGLQAGQYDVPTEIQKESIGLALQGSDILGAAKTGSGKTLSFLVPALECLYRQKWNQLDGLGVLIISPTRELAYQTFEVLKKIGRFHDFSAGLVIGGKHLREEMERINKTNIVVCTPGRLLQHMDETYNFRADSLQILVLDEADRILDMGFAQTMNGILENLPSERQTLLFSATQTRSVKDLARLSLKDPMYVSVHENAEHSTPTQLEQSYVICELHDKLNLLWSFIKNHLKCKVLIFLSSCKQVKYVYEAFCRLRPGITLLALHGSMNQLKRVDVYNQFCRKNHAVLFATDIAARGLDFPAINWVLQLDCPEDGNTYIHRVGRTARFQMNGEALLVLMPSEEAAMLEQLEQKKIPVERIKVNPKKLWSVQSKLESQCAADPALKEKAQRAFVSYLRSVFLMSNKKVFDPHKLDTDKFSSALGLAIPPRVRFLQREQKRLQQKASKLESKKQKTVATKVTESRNKSSNESDLSDSSEAAPESPSSSKSLSQILKKLKSQKGLIAGTSKQHSVTEIKSQTNESDEVTDSESSDSDVEAETQANSSLKFDMKSSNDEASSDDDDDDDEEESSSDSGSNTKQGSFNFDVEDDDDDLFTVKRVHLVDTEPIEDQDDEVGISKNKKNSKKSLTKVANAKKLLKKNLKANTKVLFDDSGEAVEDKLKKRHVETIPDTECGINIEAARKLMQEEDKVDKELYRQKIRQKHRDERLKKKADRRKAKNPMDDEEVEAELITRGDEGNALDFLPDPDELYGKEESEDSDDSEERPSPKKRKLDVQPSESEDESEDMDSMGGSEEGEEEEEEEGEDSIMDTGLTLQDDEEIALKLLSA